MKKLVLMACAALAMFCACGEKSNKTEAGDSGSPEVVPAVVSNQIAYIDLDSLLANYDMYVDKNTELQAKAQKAETELNSKGRSLEKLFLDAQEKIEKGLVTRSEAAQLQEDIQKQEQSFYEHRNKVQAELAEENDVMLNNIINNIDAYLAEFNSDYRYSMILTTTGGTPVLHADPRLNITDVVLKGLNERYSAEKKAGAKK